MPDVVAIVLVELPAGQTRTYTREMIKVTGKLSLNAVDPENFLYTVGKAKVTDAE